jgi:hypothetical protein
MEPYHWLMIGLGAAGFLVNMLVLAAVVTWKLSRVEKSIRDDFALERKSIDVELDNMGRAAGESVAAVREKIVQVELFCRDTFLRRETFFEVNRKNDLLISEMMQEIRKRLERIEDHLIAVVANRKPAQVQ